MKFQGLVPLEVLEDHALRLAMGGPKQRALPAVLLLHAGEVLSADRRPPLQRRPGAASDVIFLNGRHASHLQLGRQPDSWNLWPLSWAAKACVLVWRSLMRVESGRFFAGHYRRACQQWPEG